MRSQQGLRSLPSREPSLSNQPLMAAQHLKAQMSQACPPPPSDHISCSNPGASKATSCSSAKPLPSVGATALPHGPGALGLSWPDAPKGSVCSPRTSGEPLLALPQPLLKSWPPGFSASSQQELLPCPVSTLPLLGHWTRAPPGGRSQLPLTLLRLAVPHADGHAWAPHPSLDVACPMAQPWAPTCPSGPY